MPNHSSSKLDLGGFYVAESYGDYFYIFPYQDGTMYGFMHIPKEAVNCNSFKSLDGSFEEHPPVKYSWGAYKLIEDSIMIQQVYPIGLGLFTADYGVSEKHGRLINDTSFVLTKQHIDKRTNKIHEVFLLVRCDFKPDSSYFPFKRKS
jgi:hypothetical protein